MCSFSVVQAIRCLPPTVGVPSSRLGYSMWASWKKSSLCRFFSGFLTFSPTTNFIPPLFHTHLIPFVSFVPVMVHQAWSGGILIIHEPSIKGLHRISRPGHVSDMSCGYVQLTIRSHPQVDTLLLIVIIIIILLLLLLCNIKDTRFVFVHSQSERTVGTAGF